MPNQLSAVSKCLSLFIAVALIQNFAGVAKNLCSSVICFEVQKRGKVIQLFVDIALSTLEPPKIPGYFPHLSLVMECLF